MGGGEVTSTEVSPSEISSKGIGALKLDDIFGDKMATGARAWAPTSGKMPPLYGGSSVAGHEAAARNGVKSKGVDLEEGLGQNNITSTHNRKRVNDCNRKQDRREKKISAAAMLSRQLDRICDSVERRSSMPFIQRDPPGCSIQEVVNMMTTIPGCKPMSELFMFGTRLFLKRECREMFAALEDHEIRLVWLKHEQLRDKQASNKNLPGCSIKEVLNMMTTIPGCEPRSELFMLGTHLFVKLENREMFVALGDHVTRLVWLKQEQLRVQEELQMEFRV